MAERRGSRRNPDDRRPRDPLRSVMIPEPSGRPITPYRYNGEDVTPGMIIRLFRRGQAAMARSRAAILRVRAMRRKEAASLIQLNPKWARRHPEAASWVQDVLEQRTTLEFDLIARVGAVEPEYSREPLGFLERDDDDAEAFESYMETWRTSPSGPPTPVFTGKGVEDGEYARVTLPTHLDMDGCPDFFDYLDEAAYDGLPSDEKPSYRKDDDDRKKRYRRVDKDGNPKINPRFDKGDDKKSEEAHQDAVRRYLLRKQASNTRVIPALDCAPILARGKGRTRWELVGLVERTLYTVEELLEAGYGWKGMGDRRVLPRAYDADGRPMTVGEDEVGSNGQFYLYTAYLQCKEKDGKRDGHVRPVLFYTVGGAGTTGGGTEDEPSDKSVGCLDLFEAFKLPDGTCPAMDGARLWSYHWGTHTEDDDPDYYSRPYLDNFYERIRSIEGAKTTINIHTAINGSGGYFYTPDPAWADSDRDAIEAILEEDGNLRRPRVPRTGEIETATGSMTPAQMAEISRDLWQQLSADLASLQAATASDQAPGGQGSSGHAMVVQQSISTIAKRQVREGVKDAVVESGESHARILKAIHDKWGYRWPLQITKARPVSGEMREGREPIEFDPRWVGEGHYTLVADYPEEENLARRDIEMNAAERGFGSFARVAASMGEKDSMALRKEILKDQLWRDPSVIMAAQQRIAKATGNTVMLEIQALQEAEQMSKAQVPGAGPIPMAALRRPGEGSGGPTMAQRSRGGIQAAEMSAATNEADAEAQLAVGA